MRILGIDPGPEESGWVLYDVDAAEPESFGTEGNFNLVQKFHASRPDVIACEWIDSYGMAVGREVFETCFWVGRFCEQASALSLLFIRLTRREVKLHICASSRATDSNVRQALLDRWGGKATAIGKKKTPGPLYGVKGHAWAALAVAVAFAETQGVKA